MTPAEIQSEIDRRKSLDRANAPTFRVVEGYPTLIVTPAAHAGQRPRGYGDADRTLYLRLLGVLKAAGFWVREERGVKRRYRSLAPFNHQGARGPRLRFRAECVPAWIKFEFYPDRRTGNVHGPYYLFDKLAAMDWWTRLLYRDAIRRLSRELVALGFADVTKPRFDDPRDRLEWEARESWHYQGQASIDEPRRHPNAWCEGRDRDKRPIHQGDLKCFYDWRTRRLSQGRVYSLHGGQMWCAIAGGEVRFNLVDHELFDYSPAAPRRDPKRAVASVKKLLAAAVERQDFERAIVLRDRLRVLGGEPKRAAA